MSDLFEMVLTHANKYTSADLPAEIRESNSKRITNVLVEILRLSNIARREGLLALEEYAEGYIAEREPEEIFLKKAVLLIVDGTDPEYVRDILSANILVCGTDTLQGYLKFLYLHGILSIQAGENPRIIEEKILACLPQNMQEVAKCAVERLKEEIHGFRLREESLHMEVYNSSEARALFLSIMEEKILHLTEEQLIHVLDRIDVQQLGALLPKVRENVRSLLFRYLSKEQIQKMLEDTYQWNKLSLAEALAGITELFQQMEKNGEL